MTATDDVAALFESTIGGQVLAADDVGRYVGADDATVLTVVTDGDAATLREVRPDGVVGTDRSTGGRIVGASIARQFADPAALSEHPYLHAEPDVLLDDLDLPAGEFPVGSVLATAIDPAERGQGHGRNVTLAAIERLVESGSTPILQLEWDRPDSPGVEQLRAAGYEPRSRLVDHFPPDWPCDACGSRTDESACSCDVVVFLL